MKLEDFSKELEKEDYDAIYQILYEQIMTLLKKIAKEKNLDFNDVDQMKKEKIQRKVVETFTFDYDHALFEEAGYIFYKFPWTQKKKSLVAEIIDSYQLLENNYQKYMSKKKEIEGKDAKKIFTQMKEKYLSLYQEMMHFKQKQSSKGTFARLAEELKVLYPYFDEQLTNAQVIFDNQALLHWQYIEEEFYYTDPVVTLEKDPAELFVVLDDLYYELKQNYQKHAYDYPEILMGKEENYYDILEKALTRFDDLFYQMLNERGVVTDKTGYSLLEEVWKFYPFYEEHLGGFLIHASHLKVHLKNIFDMYSFYEKDFKENYEERFEKYQKQKKEWMKDEDYLGEDVEDFEEES